MSVINATAVATDLLVREGVCLDDRQWQQWLNLYTTNAVYWVPAWVNDESESSDPNRQISQIYHDSRRGLEERVMRVESGKSVTAAPLPRTTHFVSNLVAEQVDTDLITVRASWMTQVYAPRTAKQHVNFGHYEVRLVRQDSQWLIGWKKVHLKNDSVPTLVDFYLL